MAKNERARLGTPHERTTGQREGNGTNIYGGVSSSRESRDNCPFLSMPAGSIFVFDPLRLLFSDAWAPGQGSVLSLSHTTN